jgi:hypothetical protein
MSLRVSMCSSDHKLHTLIGSDDHNQHALFVSRDHNLHTLFGSEDQIICLRVPNLCGGGHGASGEGGGARWGGAG